MTMYVSEPIEIGPGLVPGAQRVPNTKPDIVAAIGRKGLLGHRGQSLVAIAAADLARTNVFGEAAEVASAGVVVVAPRASREAVHEVDGLARQGRFRIVSILDAPNVSPNVVSSSVSIRLGAKGPAFTIDTRGGGPSAAWRLTTAMLSAGRCSRVLLVVILDEPSPAAQQLPVAVAVVVSAERSPSTPHPVADLHDVLGDSVRETAASQPIPAAAGAAS
ncbi:hypothetical protein ACIP5Y_04755 [Nocardia sp. NPDC088792]|uniref:hypothetical protein n=1 Tax=Nocardia sp. NPDC088792 TaxID=3364332 RepID=UPI00381BEF6A